MNRESWCRMFFPKPPGVLNPQAGQSGFRQIFDTDPLICTECGEPMRIIAFITDSLEVAKILEHIGEQTSRAPPLMPTDPVPSFCDFGDTNFQYPEVPWYPRPSRARLLNVERESARSAALFADSQRSQKLCRGLSQRNCTENQTKKPNTVKSNPPSHHQAQMKR